jgi:predicted signal transduction protein with EAL and GGDEF domain
MNLKALPGARFLPNASFLARWGLGGADAARHGEARLRLLARQMPAIIWSTDARLRITSSLGDGVGWLALRGDLVGRSLLERLDLEVTEDVLMKDGEAAGLVLADLKALALKVSIDDFGTGQSSLSLLHRLPIDTLKIDRSFVADMSRRRENLEIVRTIVSLGHNVGMMVVAEGVETDDQLRDLRELGCDYAQGFLFSPAVEASAAEGLLDAA